MNSNSINDLAKKFVSNTATEEEISQLISWFDSFEESEEILVVNTAEKKEYVKEKIRLHILQDIQSATPVLKWYQKSIVKVAAILTIVAGAAWFLFIPPINQAAIVKVEVPRQEKKELKLPDGSTVWLNAESSVKYSDNFGQDNRVIVLEGEAFFNVKPNSNLPFVVKAGSVTTKVLGTSFNIKAYETDQKVLVTVSTGKVQVEDAAKNIAYLEANEQLETYVSEIRTTTKRTVQATSYSAWVKGELRFDNLSFKEIADILARDYNLAIVFEDKNLEKLKFLASFEQNESIDKILDLLCKSNNTSFRFSDDKTTVYISGDTNKNR